MSTLHTTNFIDLAMSGAHYGKTSEHLRHITHCPVLAEIYSAETARLVVFLPLPFPLFYFLFRLLSVRDRVNAKFEWLRVKHTLPQKETPSQYPHFCQCSSISHDLLSHLQRFIYIINWATLLESTFFLNQHQHPVFYQSINFSLSSAVSPDLSYKVCMHTHTKTLSWIQI